MFKLIRLLIILFIAGIVFLLFYINPIIKKSIETVGPMVLNVPVTLEKSNISFLGKGELTDLTVGNPEGFQSKHLFNLGAIKLDVDLMSLTTDTIHIKEIIVDTAHMVYEGSLSKSNISTLLKSLEGESTTETQPSEPKSEKKDEPKKEESSKKLIIDHLLIKDTKVGYSNALLGGKTIELTLPTIEKRDLGKAEGGQTVEGLVQDLLKEINQSVLESLKKNGTDLGDQLKGLNKDNVKEEINKAKDKLKGLFGK